jgi:hypothetical protein
VRKLIVVGFVLMLIVAASTPVAARAGDTVRIKETYNVPEETPADPGELTHECDGGTYTLIEGTYRLNGWITYQPSLAAWEAGELGASMTVDGKATFKGVWENDGRLYRLKSKGPLRGTVFEDTNGGYVMSFDWTGKFIDLETGEVADWWTWDWSSDLQSETGVRDGTCGSLST